MMFRNFMSSVGDTVGKILEGLGGAKDYAFLLIGVIVAVLVLVVFLLSLAMSKGSRTKELTKRLKHVTGYLRRTDEISVENAPDLYREIKSLPEEVRNGWGNFMESEAGYPSEYISEPEVLKERSYQTKARAGRVFYHLFAWIVVLLGVGIAAVTAKYGMIPADAAFTKAETVTDVLIYVLSAIYIPLIVYAVFSVVLESVYKKQSKEAMRSFRTFKDALDEKVSIFREEPEETNEFYKENEEEINNAIEEIVANKIGQTEIMEIVTVPRVSDESIAAEETTTPYVVEEPAAVVPQEAEEAQAEAAATDADTSQLEVLKGLVRNALNDPDATEEELEDLQHYIMQAKIAGFKKPEDQEVLADCIDKLNAYMLVVQGKPSELTALLYVIDNAVNDTAATKDDLLELRALILAAKDAEKFKAKKDQRILTECVGMLNRLYER